MAQSTHVIPVLALFAILTLRVADSLANASRPCSISCERDRDVHHYGFDANMKQVFIDEGKCVKVYSDPSGLGCQPHGPDCQRECSPRSYTLQSHSNRTGPFMVKTVRTCYATLHHCRSCQRKPNKVYYFPGSKYQTQVDVGKCSGMCNEDEEEAGSGRVRDGSATGDNSAATSQDHSSRSCLPLRTRSVAVEGPNGYVTVDVIQNCSCKIEKCYHNDHFQSVSILVAGKRQEEMVNIGKCMGQCTGITIDPRCLQYSWDGHCIWFATETPAKCRPTEGSTYKYTDLLGNNRTLAVVKGCGCTTG